MGSPEGVGDSNEYPQHPQTVEGFWIGLTEVTDEQYSLFVKAGGYDLKEWWTDAGWEWLLANEVTHPHYWKDNEWYQPDLPVVGVSWYEARAYTRWLSQQTSQTVRLPTEAEWEWAARGMAGRIYPWGDDWDGTRLNYCDKNCEDNRKDNTVDDRFAATAPVGSYPNGATPEGVLDMAGNVWEWTSTIHKPYPYGADNERENENSADSRVVRGGSWNYAATYVRSASRYTVSLVARDALGLRLVVSPPN